MAEIGLVCGSTIHKHSMTIREFMYAKDAYLNTEIGSNLNTTLRSNQFSYSTAINHNAHHELSNWARRIIIDWSKKMAYIVTGKQIGRAHV